MADEMLRVAGRGEDGTAKAISTDSVGNVGTKINGNKSLVRSWHGISLEPSTNVNVSRKIESNLIEIVVVASELNREVSVSPLFGVYDYNLKENISQTGDYTQFLIGESNSREVSFTLQAVGDQLRALVLESTDGQPINVDVFIWEVFAPKQNHGKYVYKEITAGTSLDFVKFDVSKVNFITNDGTADVQVGLNQFLVTDAKIRLKPGETLNNIDIPIQKLFFQSESGSQSIRAMGVK